jgi:hypothetical protein
MKGCYSKGHDAPCGWSDPRGLAEPAGEEQVARRREVQGMGREALEVLVPLFVDWRSLAARVGRAV